MQRPWGHWSAARHGLAQCPEQVMSASPHAQSIDTACFLLLCPHSPGPTQFALAVLSSAVTRSVDSEVRADKLLSAIARLGSAISACDKLLKYPIPLAYTRHTSRFMIIWLCFLPLSLWDDCGLAAMPISTVVSACCLFVQCQQWSCCL